MCVNLSLIQEQGYNQHYLNLCESYELPPILDPVVTVPRTVKGVYNCLCSGNLIWNMDDAEMFMILPICSNIYQYVPYIFHIFSIFSNIFPNHSYLHWWFSNIFHSAHGTQKTRGESTLRIIIYDSQWMTHRRRNFYPSYLGLHSSSQWLNVVHMLYHLYIYLYIYI